MKDEIKIPSSVFSNLINILLAVLANGTSKIENVSFSEEVQFAVRILKNYFFIDISFNDNNLIINGIGDKIYDEDYISIVPDNILQFKEGFVLSFNMFLTLSSLFKTHSIFSFVEKRVRHRDYYSYLSVLKQLGCNSYFAKKTHEMPMINVGVLAGGNASLDLLDKDEFLCFMFLILPLCKQNSVIETKNINNFYPVICIKEMFKNQNIKVFFNSWSYFVLNGNQKYSEFVAKITGDIGMLNFFLVYLACTRRKFKISNVDLTNNIPILKLLSSLGHKFEIDAGILFFHPAEKPIKIMNLNLSKNPEITIFAIVLFAIEGQSIVIETSSDEEAPPNLAKIRDSIIEINKIGGNIRLDENKILIDKSNFSLFDTEIEIDLNFDFYASIVLLLIKMCKINDLKLKNCFDFESKYLGFDKIISDL